MPCLSLFILVALFGSPALGIEPLRVLEGRIIRALAVHPEETSRILVGNKGKKAGSALVFESRDGGRNWSTLNGGTPLAPEASDVQAVVYGPGRSVLAGTWKHGLYRSLDGGESFERLADFPSADIRDLKRPLKQPHVIFAATGRDGLFKSLDGGATWHSLGLEGIFFWSLSVSPSGQIVYAASPEKAVYRSLDGGMTWRKVFERQAAYHVASSPVVDEIVALAGESGLFVSMDQGDSWQMYAESSGTKFSSVLWPKGELVGNSNAPWAGAWADGLHVHSLHLAESNPATQHGHRFPGLPVIHLRQAGATLLIGTWGKGLFILQ